MKLRPIYCLAALSVAAAAVAPFAIANAQNVNQPLLAQNQAPNQSEKGDRGAKRLERLTTELNLTPDQVDRIKAIHVANQADSGDRQQMRTESEKLKALMATGSRSELEQQHAKVQALRQERGDRRFSAMLDTLEVLTPEQRTKFAELMQNRRGMKGQRGGWGRNRGEAQSFLQNL